MKLKTYFFAGVLVSLILTVAAAGGRLEITNFHGTQHLLSTGEYAADNAKYFVTATITGATADENGKATVNFKVEDKDENPIVGITGADFNIAKLVPKGEGRAFNKWVAYIYRQEVVKDSDKGDWPNPDGTEAYQAYREPDSQGTLADHGDGTYTYVFKTNLTQAMAGNMPISYERNLTHRVSVMIGGHSGPTADANFDFVPDGSPVTETRNIVETATCQNCHGEFNFHGHGGDRLTMENCVTCHNPDQLDAQSGETVDMAPMIHKIHAGSELASIAGEDGIVFDNPATEVDESVDNGTYAIWGHRNSKHTWWNAGFPAVIENCTTCHQGSGEDVDNWKTVPSRDACGSCHDDVDFVTGKNHKDLPQENDDMCAMCHKVNEGSLSVVESHDWTDDDPRNIPEFTIDLSVSQPANGTHFVAGESPMVTIVINEDAAPIDHTTIVEDTDGHEGCLEDGCPDRDGKFYHAYLFVHGPRSLRNPVLTTAARVEVVSSSAGPFDLGAEDAALSLVVDGGKALKTKYASISGAITVNVEDGTWGDVKAATPAEIVDWLNANGAFAARAIAYLEGDKVAIRSRNLGDFYSLKLEPGAVTDAVFDGNTSVQTIGGYYVSNNAIQYEDPAKNDPKAAWTAGAITYTLDPVDDLKPGTYVASVEIADRGRIDRNNYRTPSVARVTFQVGTPTEELPPAENCASCHQGPDGRGFVLDFMRHYKEFDDAAVDGCGACHDYQNRDATGAYAGGRPISKRVHAVHNGSSLNYPLATVEYPNDPITGRNWNITFTQDIRNCEACHPDYTTSGSWKTEASRLPCSGCHDSDAATAHFKLQTYDPTPADPWNGDEEESCKTCH